MSFGSNNIPYTGRTKVATKEEAISLFEQKYREKSVDILSFYSSDLNCIIDDPALMVVPIDERMINRAHGVFDSMAITKFRFFRLTQHLERFQKSAKKVGIDMPMPIASIQQIMMDMASFTYKKLAENPKFKSKQDLEKVNINIRIWLSSGKGDFGIYSHNKQPIFYACTFIPTVPYQTLKEGVKEYTVQLGKAEQENISSAKSTNYLENCIIANSSKSRGGYLGIKVDDDGNLLEAAIANIAIVSHSNVFLTPPPDKIIEGTTLKKCISYIESNLIQQGLISKVELGYFNEEFVLKNAKEVIIIGGDKVIPVLQLNDKQIGTGEKGDVCNQIQEWFSTQKQDVGDEPVDVSFLDNVYENN